MPPRNPKDHERLLKKYKKHVEKHLTVDELKERKAAGKLRRALQRFERLRLADVRGRHQLEQTEAQRAAEDRMVVGDQYPWRFLL